jgi:hypothetical protein
VPKLPRPRRPLVPLDPQDVRTLRRGTRLYRVYRVGGPYPAGWNTMREYGPTSARFDPQVDPPRNQERGVLYAAGSIPTALAEAFGLTRVIERRRDDPWLAGFRLVIRLRLLDLTGAWPTRAGGSQAISSGRKDIARTWAQAVYEEYEVDGLWYPSSMSGTLRRRGDPRLLGYAVALFDRASVAVPKHPDFHLPLSHPALAGSLGVIAERYGYRMLEG